MFSHKLKINPTQQILTKQQYDKLVENFYNAPTGDIAPVVKFFNPVGGHTWYFTELDPSTGVGYGLVTGTDFPEYGSTDLNELIALQGKLVFGMSIERDINYHSKKTLSELLKEAEGVLA